MTITSHTTRALEKLLTLGEVPAAEINPLNTAKALGLWTPSADNSRAVATSAAVKLLQALPSLPETIAAILSCEPDIRLAWGKIIAARLKELGQRRDTPELCEAINKLGQAASALLPLLPQSALTPTHYSDLERIIFEAPAEQAVATPKLLRVLGATAHLVEGKQGTPAESLPDIDPLNPSINWVRGRLLRLPRFGDGEMERWGDGEKAPNPKSLRVDSLAGVRTPATKVQNPKSSVLSGDWSELTPAEINPDDTESQAIMRWVLYRPWAFLLAQIVFTQEAWAAERISGNLSLELEESQLSQFHQPTQVLVVITTAAGEEVICGILAELLLRVLSQLGVSLLTPTPSPVAALLTKGGGAELNNRLAPVIKALLQHRVWSFNSGNSRQRSGYTIHPSFSDSCYQILGSKSFYRLGSPVTAAIRNTCDCWVSERLATAGSTAFMEVIST